MSTYSLTPLDAYAGHDITVGWDPRLATFYVQVRDTADTADTDTTEGRTSAHLWLPVGTDTLTDAATVIDLIRPYAHIRPTLLADLKADQAHVCANPHHQHNNPSDVMIETEILGLAAELADQVDRFIEALHANDAGQAADILHHLIETDHGALACRLMTLALTEQLNKLPDHQRDQFTARTLFGVAITGPHSTHIAIETPDREGVHRLEVTGHDRTARNVVPAIGYDPDRYVLHSYPTDSPIEIIWLTPTD